MVGETGFSELEEMVDTQSRKYGIPDEEIYRNNSNLFIAGSASEVIKKAEITKGHAVREVARLFLVTQMVLTACAGPMYASTITKATIAAPTPTVEITNIPTETQTPSTTATPEASATLSVFEGDLSGLAAAPDMTVDSAGFHITLPDSSRVVDIAPGDISKEVIFDSEYNLFKIYDDKGNITAEYDAGQGKDGEAEYVPSTGWVDVQTLSKNLICEEGDGKTCINEQYRGDPN